MKTEINENQSRLDEEHKIITAAYWKTASEHPMGVDAVYKLFCQHMEHRREIARRYLKEPDGTADKKYLKEIFEMDNTKLKQILGL